MPGGTFMPSKKCPGRQMPGVGGNLGHGRCVNKRWQWNQRPSPIHWYSCVLTQMVVRNSTNLAPVPPLSLPRCALHHPFHLPRNPVWRNQEWCMEPGGGSLYYGLRTLSLRWHQREKAAEWHYIRDTAISPLRSQTLDSGDFQSKRRVKANRYKTRKLGYLCVLRSLRVTVFYQYNIKAYPR